MKKKETKKLTKDQSLREIQKLKKDLFNMRFKKINGQIQNMAEFSTIKRNIARLYNNVQGKKWQKKFYREKLLAIRLKKLSLLKFKEDLDILFMGKLYQDLKNIMHMMKKINIKKEILLKLLSLNQYQNSKHGRYLKSDTSTNRITSCW